MIPAWPAAIYPAAVLLVLVLPFEAVRPVVTTPWFALTDEKVGLLVAALAWLLLGARGLPSSAEWRALAPSLALLVAAVVAAVLAPEFGDEALKFVWRLAAAAFVPSRSPAREAAFQVWICARRRRSGGRSAAD